MLYSEVVSVHTELQCTPKKPLLLQAIFRESFHCSRCRGIAERGVRTYGCVAILLPIGSMGLRTGIVLTYIYHKNQPIHVGVSLNGGTPKWMVYKHGKPYEQMDEKWGVTKTHHFGKPSWIGKYTVRPHGAGSMGGIHGTGTAQHRVCPSWSWFLWDQQLHYWAYFRVAGHSRTAPRRCWPSRMEKDVADWVVMRQDLLQLLWVDRGILYVGPTKSLTCSRGAKGCHD